MSDTEKPKIIAIEEHYFDPEIADKLGWSRSKVKVRAHRARRRLRAQLSGEEAR